MAEFDHMLKLPQHRAGYFKYGDYVIVEPKRKDGKLAYKNYEHVSKITALFADAGYHSSSCTNVVNGLNWVISFSHVGYAVDKENDNTIVSLGNYVTNNNDKVRLATEEEIAEALLLALHHKTNLL